MRRNIKDIFKSIFRITWKSLAVILLLGVLIFVGSSVTFIYNFPEPRPFSGPDIYNPYASLDSTVCWKRANFHTHTHVEGPLNECLYWPDATDSLYRMLGYDIVTFSNHNELTLHPYDTALQVNVYEHGYNIFQYHKLVFGSESVNYFDHLLPLLASQKQFQLDLLGKTSDFIQLNHPSRTRVFPKSQIEKLEGFEIMELDSHKTTENEYWDWSLSAGHYTFGLANDDLHHPERTYNTAIRCNFVDVASGRYADLKEALLGGAYYAMRVPDYGNGDWDEKIEGNQHLPAITAIGLDSLGTIFMTLSAKADSIKVTGQGHTTLALATDTNAVAYKMLPTDSYARLTAFFPGGEVIYTNPFARYDSSVAESPRRSPSHTVNLPLTILFNLLILLLCSADVYLIVRIIKS